MSEVFYFGCVRTSGHYLWTRNFAVAREAGPFKQTHLDTPYCPGMTPTSRGITPADQPEGVARITHENGWTVLSFWDRSVDNRRGSHSTFVMDGTHDFDAAVALAREAFPRVWARYGFEVRRE